MIAVALLPECVMVMRGKTPIQREGPLAQWLFGHRKSRGLTMTVLAEKAGVSHPRIVQLEQGDTTTRDMVQRLARALVPADLDPAEAEESYRRLVNEGLRAAGFAAEDDAAIIYDDDLQFIVEAWNGTNAIGRRALKNAAELALEMIRERSIGKRAE